MNQPVFNVLFLCTGNSARSVMAEALMTILGAGRFKGFSAGSHPTGTVNAFAIEQIKTFDATYPTEWMLSKSWDKFSTTGAPQMDFIITVCDNAAGEVCPYWPGHPVTAHWGFNDPAAVEGDIANKRAAFYIIFNQIKSKLNEFVALPIEEMDAVSTMAAFKRIGEMPV